SVRSRRAARRKVFWSACSITCRKSDTRRSAWCVSTTSRRTSATREDETGGRGRTVNPWFRLDGLRFPGHGARNPTGGPWWTIAALAAVSVFALSLRLDNLVRWQELPHAYFVDDAPMLLNVDGYYYLDLARDLAEGNYKPVDLDRVVPDGRPRPL